MLAIGRALMTHPRFLMLDEPSQGIMPRLVDDILAAVTRIRALGVTVLLVEQKALAALEISHWGYVLALGRVVLSAPTAQLLARSDLGEVFLGQVATPEAGPPPSTQTPSGPHLARIHGPDTGQR